MHSTPYLQNRNGHYHLRIRIPSDLSETICARELVKSLKTKDKKTATVAAMPFQEGIFKTFSLLRSGFITGEQASSHLSSLLGTKREISLPTQVETSDSALTTPKDNKRSLSTIVKHFIQDRQHGWGQKTKMENEGSYRLVLDILGDVDITCVDRSTVRNLRDKLLMLPANLYKLFPKKTASEVLKVMDSDSPPQGITPMSITSVNKHISRFSTLMKFCIKEGYVKTNPATGLKMKQKRRPDEERKAYSNEDIERITKNLPKPSGRPERFWIPLIGLLSGLRLDEICSLYVEDVKKVEGVWCFDINENHDKKVKTLSSIRIVPLHPSLIKLGFLEYHLKMLKAGHPRLWMNLQWRKADGYGNAFGKWFQRFNRQCVTSDPQKSFHSLRHSFADTLKQAGTSEVLISELMGHLNGNITTGRYGKRFKAGVLLEALKMLSFEGFCDVVLGSVGGDTQQ